MCFILSCFLLQEFCIPQCQSCKIIVSYLDYLFHNVFGPEYKILKENLKMDSG